MRLEAAWLASGGRIGSPKQEIRAELDQLVAYLERVTACPFEMTTPKLLSRLYPKRRGRPPKHGRAMTDKERKQKSRSGGTLQFPVALTAINLVPRSPKIMWTRIVEMPVKSRCRTKLKFDATPKRAKKTDANNRRDGRHVAAVGKGKNTAARRKAT
jgi:hypothetical protein